jgi:hypothetical protein
MSAGSNINREEMKTNQEMLAKMEAKADINLRETKDEINNQERMEAKT